MPAAFAAGAVAILVILIGGVVLVGSPSKVASPSPSPIPSATSGTTPSPSSSAGAATSATARPLVQGGEGVNTNGPITFSLADETGKRFLYLVGPASTNLNQVVAAEPCCGVFSPDGRKLAVGEVDPRTSSYRTVIFPVAGGASTVLPTFCGGCGSLANLDYRPRAWSPDGHWVAIEGTSDAEPQQRDGLYLAVADGKPMTGGLMWAATVTGAGHHDVPLAFSPDSAYLLFKRADADSDAGDLFVLKVSAEPGAASDAPPVKLNTAGTKIVSSDAFGPGASWSPDGRQVAFSATHDEGSGASVDVVTVSTGKVKTIAAADPTTTSARWSPDGQWIAYDVPGPGGRHDEWVIHPDGSGARNLTTSFDGGVCCGDWSPDSQWLVAQGGAYDGTDRPDQLLGIGLDGTTGVIVQLETPTQLEDYAWAPPLR